MAKPLADQLESLPSSNQPDACVFPKAAAMAEKHTGTISTKFYDESSVCVRVVKEKFLSDAAEQYPKAAKYLAAWTKTVRAATWRNMADVRRC